MISRKKRLIAAGALLVCAAGVAGTLWATAASATDDLGLSSVPANPDVRGITYPNVLSPQLDEHVVAQGSMKLENGVTIAQYYGYNGNGSLMPDPKIVQAPGTNVEASKTEPDKNTYLKLRGLHGGDPNYD